MPPDSRNGNRSMIAMKLSFSLASVHKNSLAVPCRQSEQLSLTSWEAYGSRCQLGDEMPAGMVLYPATQKEDFASSSEHDLIDMKGCRGMDGLVVGHRERTH